MKNIKEKVLKEIIWFDHLTKKFEKDNFEKRDLERAINLTLTEVGKVIDEVVIDKKKGVWVNKLTGEMFVSYDKLKQKLGIK